MAAAPVTAGSVPARRRSRGIPDRRLAVLMVTPSMALIALVALYPVIYGVWVSLHQYSLIQAGLSRWASPAGLGNYKEALQSSAFWSATRITVEFTIASVFLETLIGLGMALAMKEAFKGQGLLRTVVLVPWAVLTVVTAIMWKTIFDPNLRFVNQLLGGKTVWLGSEPQALLVMIFADTWKTAPFMALLLLAGLQVNPLRHL
jgi:multiple sugar transport system permease protein